MAASVVRYITILGICLLTAALAAGALLAKRIGADAYVASLGAAGVMWILCGVSLVLVATRATPQGRLNAILLGMLLRMTIPLVALVYFSQAGESKLQAAGNTTFIVIHYLVGLVVETLLCVRLVKAADRQGSPSTA